MSQFCATLQLWGIPAFLRTWALYIFSLHFPEWTTLLSARHPQWVCKHPKTTKLILPIYILQWMARSMLSCSSQLLHYRWTNPRNWIHILFPRNCSAQQVCAAGFPKWLFHRSDSSYMAIGSWFSTLTRAPGFVSTPVPTGTSRSHRVTAHSPGMLVSPLVYPELWDCMNFLCNTVPKLPF